MTTATHTTLRIGSWETHIDRRPVVLHSNAVRAYELAATDLHRIYAARMLAVAWRGLRETGLVSPIVRLDCAPLTDEEAETRTVSELVALIKSKLYEFEPRPGGLGVALDSIPGFGGICQKALRDYDLAGFIKTPDSPMADDRHFAENVGLPCLEGVPGEDFSFPEPGERWFVRSETRDLSAALRWEEGFSAVPIIRDGSKLHLVDLGLAWAIARSDAERAYLVEHLGVPTERIVGLDEIVWKGPEARPLVFKPAVGKWSVGVMAYAPNNASRKRMPGSSTQTQVERTFARFEEDSETVFLVQEYVPPLRLDNGSFAIDRPFFVAQSDGTLRFAGGHRAALDQVRVHGTGDTVFRPIVAEHHLRVVQ